MTFSSDSRISANATGSSFNRESAHRIRQRIQIQIPTQYAQEPVISTLTTRYGLDVNILSALLATNSRESGWFDLELHGVPARIDAAIAYLTQLRIEVLTDDAATQQSWAFR